MSSPNELNETSIESPHDAPAKTSTLNTEQQQSQYPQDQQNKPAYTPSQNHEPYRQSQTRSTTEYFYGLLSLISFFVAWMFLGTVFILAPIFGLASIALAIISLAKKEKPVLAIISLVFNGISLLIIPLLLMFVVAFFAVI